LAQAFLSSVNEEYSLNNKGLRSFPQLETERFA